MNILHFEGSISSFSCGFRCGGVLWFDGHREGLVAEDAILLAELVDLFAEAVSVEDVSIVARQGDNLLATPDAAHADATVEVLALFVEKGTVRKG